MVIGYFPWFTFIRDYVDFVNQKDFGLRATTSEIRDRAMKKYT